MRFLVLSDIHSNFYAFERILKNEEFDVLLIAGDITDFRASDVLLADKIVGKYCDCCFAVHGNCDPEEVLNFELENIEFIHAKSVKLSNYTLHGLGGSNYTPFMTPSEYSEERIESFMENFKFSDYNILLTHCPPKGVLDKTYHGENAGSEAIRNVIDKFDLVFCGHIHEAYGIERIGKTLVVNPGPAMWGMYVLFDLDRFSAVFKSIR